MQRMSNEQALDLTQRWLGNPGLEPNALSLIKQRMDSRLILRFNHKTNAPPAEVAELMDEFIQEGHK